jgi:hypothetical protein
MEGCIEVGKTNRQIKIRNELGIKGAREVGQRE